MRRYMGTVLGLVLAGCQAVPVTIPSVSTEPSAHQLTLQAAGDEASPARLFVHLAVPDRTTQALPTNWDTATLRLDGATLRAPLTKTLAKGTDIVASGSTYTATGVFGELRPTRYVLTVDLWYGGVNGTLEAEQQQAVSLVGGSNAVAITTQVYPTLGLTGFTPASGNPGDVITLSGQAFSVLPSQDQLTLGNLNSSLTAASSVSLSAKVPDLAPGSYSWQLQVGNSLAGKAGFNVLGTIGSSLYWLTLPTQQTYPAIAHGSDRYLVTWDDNRNGSMDVFGRMVDASGSTLVGDFDLAPGTATTEKPQVVYNPALNQFMVVWQDGANNSDIRSQVVGADGTLIGSSLGICTLASPQTKPQITYASSKGQYAVVWVDSRTGTNNIYAQLVNANGTLSGGNIAITSSTAADDNPAIVYDATADKYLVVYDEALSPKLLKGRVLNSDGTLGAGPFVISPPSANDQVQGAPGVDPSSGDLFVTWVCNQNPNLVRGQRVSISGSLVGSPVTLANASGTKNYPAIAYESWRNKFIVVWNDGRNTNSAAYGQYVAIDGTLWGSNFNVSNLPNDVISNVAVDVDPKSQHGMAAFQDGSNSGDIYGQIMR